MYLQTIISIAVNNNPLYEAYVMKYWSVQIFPLPGKPLIPKHLVNILDNRHYESIFYLEILIAHFCSENEESC